MRNMNKLALAALVALCGAQSGCERSHAAQTIGHQIREAVDIACHAITIFGVKPNTFNPLRERGSDLQFQIDQDGEITIYVKDSEGMVVNILVASGYPVKAGKTLHVFWDGRDSLRRIVPEGTYHIVIHMKSNAGDENADSIPVTVTR